jgi:hypothetical protein
LEQHKKNQNRNALKLREAPRNTIIGSGGESIHWQKFQKPISQNYCAPGNGIADFAECVSSALTMPALAEFAKKR